MAVDEDLVQLGDYNPAVAIGPVRQLLTSANRPTAIFAASDACALAAIDVATELGHPSTRRRFRGRFRQHPWFSLEQPFPYDRGPVDPRMGRQAAAMLV